jgi:hypothetical protein
MKPKQNTTHLLNVMIPLILLCGPVWAQPVGPYFFDDFSDGDPADGSPVNWLPVAGPDPGGQGYILVPEGLDADGVAAGNLDGLAYAYRDVAITVEIKRKPNQTNGEWVSGISFRWNLVGPDGYWIEVRPPNRFWLGHSSRWVLSSASLPFNVDEQDLVIHVEAVGDEIKGWCWPVGAPMPDVPQISIVDEASTEGAVALYSSTHGGQTIFCSAEVATLDIPFVDFNGSGRVDIDDLVRLIESWGQDDPICDVAPLGACDGIVDVGDLEVLMSYWDQDINDRNLINHWKMDETEGDVASDSISKRDAIVIGDPLWEPEGGHVKGAIQLDGINDCMETHFVLNPQKGMFSAFAWIKGGQPGQVIMSQQEGADWLATDAQGCLMTSLISGGRYPGDSLVSETIVTDGHWHRVGFVWDRECRSLYVDDKLAAIDVAPQDNFSGSQGRLVIGAAGNQQLGTFWSGLIDDVRIYDRAVTP